MHNTHLLLCDIKETCYQLMIYIISMCGSGGPRSTLKLEIKMYLRAASPASVLGPVTRATAKDG